MTLGEIRDQVMFQTGNEINDVPDFAPCLLDYINEGYGLLRAAYGMDVSSLALDTDVPDLPAWAHRALADYATYLAYRNGNAARQQRGVQFYASFRDTMARLGVREDKGVSFTHLFD